MSDPQPDAHVPSIRIVIPAYQAKSTLPSVLSAAAHQAEELHATIVVVDSSADGTGELVERRFPSVEVVALPERTLPGQARNIGAAAGDEELLVFLDADAVPESGWLDGMLAALGPDDAAAASAVGNGTPTSAVGTAGWLLEFSNWLPGNVVVEMDHAASASLLVRRVDFEAAGGFPEDVWPGEDTILTSSWGREGRLAFAGDAVVLHLNRTRLRDFLEHQRSLGAAFAQVCSRTDFRHGRFGRRPWAGAAGGLRIAALAQRLRRPADRASALRLSPIIALGLLAWTKGVWTNHPERAAPPDPTSSGRDPVLR